MSAAQQINLHQLHAGDEAPPLAAARLVQLGGALLIVLALLYAHGTWRVWSAENELDAERSRRVSESSRLVELTALHPPQPVDASLQARVEALSVERVAKTHLLELLSNQSLGNTLGFSEPLTALARRRVTGLWLNEVRLRQGGQEVELAGSALSGELVPRLLQELSSEEVCKELFRIWRMIRIYLRLLALILMGVVEQSLSRTMKFQEPVLVSLLRVVSCKDYLLQCS